MAKKKMDYKNLFKHIYSFHSFVQYMKKGIFLISYIAFFFSYHFLFVILLVIARMVDFNEHVRCNCFRELMRKPNTPAEQEMLRI